MLAVYVSWLFATVRFTHSTQGEGMHLESASCRDIHAASANVT